MALRAASAAIALAAITCGLAWSGPAAAQPVVPPAPATFGDDVPRGQIRFRSFGAPDGLHNLVVVSIVQDGDGLLWVATDDGVYRYDGQQFTHYSTHDGLPAMGVRVLGVAPDGAVCAGTRSGMACWNGARFTSHGAEGVNGVWVQSLASSPGALWAGTAAGLLVRRGDGAFAPAPGWPGPPRSVPSLWADADGVIAADGAAVQVSAGNGEWRRLGAEVGLDRERIDAVVRDRDGTLWIRSLHHLWTLPRGAAQVVDLSAGLPPGSDKSGVACGMAIAPWGEVLVGSERGVAYRHDQRWQVIDHTVGNTSPEARALLVDREGTIWVGSLGLTQWMGRGLVTRHDLASGLPGYVVWSIARDRHGQLWVGTDDCLARAVDGRWECIPATRGWSVRSFVFMPDGGVFLGGGPPDLLYVDPSGRGTRLELEGPRVADRHLMTITLGPGGDLWIASTTGLYRLAGAVPGQPQRVQIPGVRSDVRTISALFVDDRLWVAGDGGLAVLDSGRWRVLDRSSGFRASVMRYVIRRRDGRMCTSYTDVDGVTCFRWDGEAVSERTDITPSEGLTSGRVYAIGEDRERRLWVGTGDGVDIVTPRGVDHFDETEGLAGNDTAARAFYEDLDGSIWLGASSGVSHILAQHYIGPPAPPRTTVLQSWLGGALVDPDHRGPLEADHDHNAITASFAADSFIAPRRVAFQIRLSPLERTWSTTRLREARYPALPPGSYQLEMRARTGAGAWGPVSQIAFVVKPAWWQTGWFIVLASALGLAVVAGAITWRLRVMWRRRDHQLRRQSDASFRELIESMPDVVAVHRGDKLIYLNQAAREAFAIDDDDDTWLGIRLIDRVHPDDQALVAKLFSPDGAGPMVELRIAAGDGSWRNCELSSRRIALADGHVVVVSGRDVTERHRLRAKLMLSDRMVSLGTLAAGIAHEINNPLSYVTANLEIVTEALGERAAAAPSGGDDELQAALSDACEGAERVRKIVRGLRSFSRSEEEQRTPLALPDVLAVAIRLTSNEVRHRAVLVKELAPTPLVLADESRLAQVFINLLINAAHAIPEGHTDANRITVRTRTDDQGRAVVEIADSGEGMAPEVQARAFDPFFTTKEVGEGTGLGLSICHGIVTGLGGQIAIESARGHGSVVRVVLPAATGEAVAATEPLAAAAATAAHRRRVMIVDDEPRVAMALKRMLLGDHDLTLAANGAEAIEHVIAGERFDAIITDVMMPNMTGVELFDRISDVAPDQAPRMIFLTGGVFTAQTRTRLEASGNPTLQKPVSSRELRACVASLPARPAR